MDGVHIVIKDNLSARFCILTPSLPAAAAAAVESPDLG